jgi:hypothetical protein
MNPWFVQLVVFLDVFHFDPYLISSFSNHFFFLLQKFDSINQDISSSADWILDKNEFESMFNSRTRLIILNNPNNPLGKVSLSISYRLHPSRTEFSRFSHSKNSNISQVYVKNIISFAFPMKFMNG